MPYEPSSDLRRASTYSANSEDQALSLPENMRYDASRDATYGVMQGTNVQAGALDSHVSELLVSAPQHSPAHHLETFFFRRFITSIWLHSQVEAWQYWLPRTLRNSQALYFSVLSLSALYMSKMESQPRIKEFSLSLYQGTLGHLQKALYDPIEAMRDETLMATIVIGLYELIDKPDSTSWASHSRGTAELLKMRGSEAVRGGLGRTLFLTFRGYEVIRAIVQCEETFLADEVWTVESSTGQTLQASNGLLHEIRKPRESAAHPSPDYAAVLFMLGGQVANLQVACVRYHQHEQQAPRQGNHASSAMRDAILEQAAHIEHKLKLWRASLPPLYNAQNLSNTLDLSSYNVAYQLCFYSAFVIFTQRLVQKYVFAGEQSSSPSKTGNSSPHRHPPRQHATEQDALARFILLTTQFLTLTSTSVNLNVTWPLFIASISLARTEDRVAAIELLRSIAREKGWAIANTAWTAANRSAQKQGRRASSAAAVAVTAMSRPGTAAMTPHDHGALHI